MSRAKKRMICGTGIFLALIAGMLIWFYIPYSPIKKEFSRDVNALLSQSDVFGADEVFSEDDFAQFPPVIQKYVSHSGFIGQPKMDYMRMRFDHVAFSQGPTGPDLRIDYTQYNNAHEPERLALIESSLYAIPFEGYDYYSRGTCAMRGAIGKAFTLFDQRGNQMDQACLATYLAESLFVPAALLTGQVSFEQIDDYHVFASLTYGTVSASGEFTFSENYEMKEFVTHDRVVVQEDGTMECVPWVARASGYSRRADGLRLPTKLQAIWEYPDEPLVYFDGEISEIVYG